MARRKKNAAASAESTAAAVTAVVDTPTSTAVESLPKAEAAAPADTVMVGLNRAQGIIYKLPGGRTVEIAGNAVHLKGLDKGILPVGAFGLTTVKREDWEWIKKTYGDTALFKSGRIYAAECKASALSEAAEKRELRNGLEPAHTVQTEKAVED